MALVCCDTLDVFTSDLCPTGENGRIRSFALVQKCFQNDFVGPYNAAFWESAANWDDLINGVVGPPAIPAYATIVDGFSGELSYEATTRDGFGNQSTINTGWTGTITGEMLWTDTNQDFFNAVNKSNDYWLVFATANKIFVVPTEINIQAAPTITNVLTDYVTWNVVLTWQYGDFALAYDKPAGIFD